jgi:hypothetical protein
VSHRDDARPICSVKHRTASSQSLGLCWDLDVRTGIGTKTPHVVAWLHVGKAVHEVDVPVCSLRNPVPGAWVVSRIDAATWRLTPLQWPSNPDRIAHGVAFSDHLPVGFVDLLCAPPVVAELLEAL